MKCEVSLPEIQREIFNAFEKAFTENKAPPEAALFFRAGDTQSAFLLSPEAVRFSSLLPGRWQLCDRPTTNRWSLSIGHHDALAKSHLDFGDDIRRYQRADSADQHRA
jgi:hypothetical protein